MADLLPEIGQISYESFIFPVKHRDFSIKGRIIESRDKRSITHTVYSLSAKLYFEANADEDVDDQMDEVRQVLQQRAGQLIVRLKGFGTLNVNGNGAQKDALWGPIPRVFGWRNLGSPAAAEIDWTCEFAIPESNAQRFNGIMDYSYKVRYSRDMSGLVTRTVSGNLSIAQTRAKAGDPTLNANAEEYLDQVTPPIPTGFRRPVAERELDESKCNMTFTFVDMELPSTNAFPEGVIIAEASHVVATTGKGVAQWVGHITATYEISKEYSREFLYRYFQAWAIDRISQAKQGTGDPHIVHMQIAEPQVFGKQGGAFAVGYVFTSSLADILRDSGLWRPVPNNDFSQWATSIKNVQRVRGLSGLSFSNDMDVIVSLTETKAVPKTVSS